MQISSRVLHLSNRRFWHKLKTLLDASARRDRWMLGLCLLMPQDPSVEALDRLVVHLNLDCYHHYFARNDTLEGSFLWFVVGHLPLTRNGINLILN